MAGFGELGSFDDRFALPEPTPADLAQAEQLHAKLAADHYFGNSPRKVLPAGYVESLPDLGPAITFGEFSPGVDWANRLFGTGGVERFQMWPERMVRSALTLPGDIASGAEPLLPPGLRREDYTDAAPPQRGSAEGIFGNRLFTPQAAQPNDPAYQRAQDLAGMSGGGMVFGELGGGKGAAASVGRDVRVLGKKIGSGEPFQHQLIDQPVGLTEPYIPPGPADRMQRPIEARIDAGLDRRANDRGLTSVANTGRTLLEDSSATGAPIAALERQRQRPVSTGFGELGPARNTMIENADLLKELAVQRRNRGESVGKSAPGWDFKRPDAPKGSWDDTVARTKAQWDVDKARAVAGFEDAAGPEPIKSPLLSKDDLEFIKSGAFYSDSATPGAPLSALEHAPKFYSGAERVVEALPQAKMPADQVRNMLINKGVKPEELQYTGTDQFLAERGKAPVTKAELQEHLAANRVKPDEVTKTSDFNSLPVDEQYRLIDNYADRYDTRPNHVDVTDPHFRDFVAESGKGATKYHGYQLPGGENYREKLLTLPSRTEMVKTSFAVEPDGRGGFQVRNTFNNAVPYFGKSETEAGEIAGRLNVGSMNARGESSNYRSSHWDEPNVLVHRRTQDRDVTGASETQSFKLRNRTSGNTTKAFPSEEAALAHLQTLPEKLRPNLEVVPSGPMSKKSMHDLEWQSDMHQQGRKNGYREPEVEAAIGRLKANKPTDADIALLQERVPNSTREYMDNRVPDAPFKKNWHELAIKDQIREAAEKGFDRISFAGSRRRLWPQRRAGLISKERWSMARSDISRETRTSPRSSIATCRTARGFSTRSASRMACRCSAEWPRAINTKDMTVTRRAKARPAVMPFMASVTAGAHLSTRAIRRWRRRPAPPKT
jgi:hypothetical protein